MTRPGYLRQLALMSIASCLIALSLIASLPQTPAEPAPEQADREEILRLEEVWNEAHRNGDAEALDRLWAEDFEALVPGMPVIPRADALGVWRSGRMKFQRYETSGLRLRLYGDAALVTGFLERIRQIQGDTVEEHWRFLKVYVRREGVWRVVAFQASE